MAFFKYNDKNIFYEEFNEGKPLILLHGNTASSKMFEFILPLYSDFKIITIDFLGHGQSDRLVSFPLELWQDQAKQVIKLIETLGYEKVNLLGTSGGAYVAINVVLERPELIDKVIADSFDGIKFDDTFVDELIAEREFASNDEQASQFYEWNQGDDWRDIVKHDTESLVSLAKSDIPLFKKDLKEIKNPILLIGSTADTMTNDVIKKYKDITNNLSNGQMYIFNKGDHPTILTNAEEVAKIVSEFIKTK